MRSLTIVAVFAVAAWMSRTAVSQAAPIASESFATSAGGNDYAPLSSILGQNPTVGSTGFTDAWGVCCTTTMVPITGGLTHELLPGETFDGQLVSNTTSGSGGGWSARNLSRAIDYTPTDGTYYMSVLLKKNAATTRGDLLAGLGRSQNGDTGVLNVEGSWIGFVDGGIWFGSGPGAYLSELRSASRTNVGETYLALLEYDFSTTGPDTVIATVYNGSSERVASQSFPGLNLDATMGRFSVFTQDWESIPRLDEWRFGTELSDVLVPELIRIRTFSSWASEQGYSPGAAMPAVVNARDSDIEQLSGFADYDWTTTPTTELILVNNQVSSIAADAFSGLTGLTWLDLGFNKITNLEAAEFSGLASLAELSLYGNQIVSIQTDAFSGLTNLARLDLRANQIATIESGAFAGLGSLPILDLSFQKLSNLEAGTFNGLTNLTELNISSNQISSIEPGAFAGLTSLTTLYLSDNQISSIEAGDFNGLTGLTSLYLYGNQISSIEEGDFSELTSLTFLGLGYNRLLSIEAGQFNGLSNLAFLDLDGNQLSNIEAGGFSGLTNLTSLFLRNNQLSNIEANAFTGLTNLTELQLSGNPIASVAPGAFNGLTSLPVLDLSYAQLTGIPAGAFDGLTGLTHLYLYGNQISNIEPGAFGGLTSLTFLDLGYNQLTNIEANSFTGLTGLMELNLSSNQISSIEAVDFSGLSSLTSLDLNGNQLSSIEPGDFSELTNLTFLSLGYNQLSNIEATALNGLTNLTTLSLYGNQISSIEAADFSGLSSLTSLDLSGNQLSSIRADDFSGLTNLTFLSLGYNQLLSIEAGAFNGAANLTYLDLSNNPALTELNLAEADFSSLTYFDVSFNENVIRVSLQNAVLNQTSLTTLIVGTPYWYTGIGTLYGITELDLSGIDFANISDLSPLYVMDNLTDLWLVDTVNLDAVALDALLDNLATIQGTAVEGVVYMTRADYDAFNLAGGDLLAAWNIEDGHHVEFVLPGDYNGDGIVGAADYTVWRDGLGSIYAQADYDVWKSHFGETIDGGSIGSRIVIPEPASVLLLLAAIAVAGLRGRAKRPVPAPC